MLNIKKKIILFFCNLLLQKNSLQCLFHTYHSGIFLYYCNKIIISIIIFIFNNIVFIKLYIMVYHCIYPSIMKLLLCGFFKCSSVFVYIYYLIGVIFPPQDKYPKIRKKCHFGALEFNCMNWPLEVKKIHKGPI